jgi:acetyl esterase/lipase
MANRRLPSLGLLLAAILLPAPISAAPPDAPARKYYLFYLHGRIVEDQGPRGVSPRFGRYDYPAILAAFRARGLEVVSEVRPRDTDPGAYADRVVGEIRVLLAGGIAPSRITVVGASKGSVIAALVSTRLRDPGVRYVLLANCNPWLIRTHDPRLTGEVLSIYEQSDQMGRSCRPVAARSPALRRFAEIRLRTGLGHGMVYRPIRAWVDPAAAWARR